MEDFGGSLKDSGGRGEDSRFSILEEKTHKAKSDAQPQGPAKGCLQLQTLADLLIKV